MRKCRWAEPPTIPELLEVESQDPLFPVEIVDCKLEARTLVVFYDLGANLNMVREEWAQTQDTKVYQ